MQQPDGGSRSSASGRSMGSRLSPIREETVDVCTGIAVALCLQPWRFDAAPWRFGFA